MKKTAKNPPFEQEHPRKEDGTFDIKPSSGRVSLKLENDETAQTFFDELTNSIPRGYEADRWKKRVVDELSQTTKISRNDVDSFIRSWAKGLPDVADAYGFAFEGNYIALQVAASQMFGVELPEHITKFIRKRKININGEYFVRHIDASKKLLQAMYQSTQKSFKEKGITRVTLYRGVKNKDGRIRGDEKEFILSSSPLSSWSSNYNIADAFRGWSTNSKKGVILKAVIPVSKIISTPHHGIGCLGEEEFVVIGGLDKVRPVARFGL